METILINLSLLLLGLFLVLPSISCTVYRNHDVHCRDVREKFHLHCYNPGPWLDGSNSSGSDEFGETVTERAWEYLLDVSGSFFDCFEVVTGELPAREMRRNMVAFQNFARAVETYRTLPSVSEARKSHREAWVNLDTRLENVIDRLRTLAARNTMYIFRKISDMSGAMHAAVLDIRAKEDPQRYLSRTVAAWKTSGIRDLHFEFFHFMCDLAQDGVLPEYPGGRLAPFVDVADHRLVDTVRERLRFVDAVLADLRTIEGSEPTTSRSWSVVGKWWPSSLPSLLEGLEASRQVLAIIAKAFPGRKRVVFAKGTKQTDTPVPLTPASKSTRERYKRRNRELTRFVHNIRSSASMHDKPTRKTIDIITPDRNSANAVRGRMLTEFKKPIPSTIHTNVAAQGPTGDVSGIRGVDLVVRDAVKTDGLKDGSLDNGCVAQDHGSLDEGGVAKDHGSLDTRHDATSHAHNQHTSSNPADSPALPRVSPGVISDPAPEMSWLPTETIILVVIGLMVVATTLLLVFGTDIRFTSRSAGNGLPPILQKQEQKQEQEREQDQDQDQKQDREQEQEQIKGQKFPTTWMNDKCII